jgi:hypothetical protein
LRWKEFENYNINLQANKYLAMNGSVKSITEQENEPKVNDSGGLVEYLKCKELMKDGSELMDEDEIVKCRVLKLRKPSDQKVNLSNDRVEFSEPELEMFDEDNGKKIALNKLIGSTSSVTDERDKSFIVDRDNFRYGESEETSDSSGGLDNDRMSAHDDRNKVAESLTELIKPLEAGEKGKGRSKDIKSLIVPELDNTPDKHSRRKPATRSSDFLWEN